MIVGGTTGTGPEARSLFFSDEARDAQPIQVRERGVAAVVKFRLACQRHAERSLTAATIQ